MDKKVRIVPTFCNKDNQGREFIGTIQEESWDQFHGFKDDGKGSTFHCLKDYWEYRPIFTKEELKDGMVVKTHGGGFYLVISNRLLGNGGHLRLESYTSDLENKNNDKFNIESVYSIPEHLCNNIEELTRFNVIGFNLVWQRNDAEIKELEERMSKLMKEAEEIREKISELKR